MLQIDFTLSSSFPSNSVDACGILAQSHPALPTSPTEREVCNINIGQIWPSQSLTAKAVQTGMMFAMFRHFLTSLPLSTHPPQLPFKEPIQVRRLRTFYVDAPFWKLK